jgi:hypothetical protein
LIVEIDPTEEEWNHYSADIYVTRESGQNAAGVYHGTTNSNFSIVRDLNGSVWSSDLAAHPLPTTGLGTEPEPDYDIGRFQTDDPGSFLEARLRNGTVVSTWPNLMTDEYPVIGPPPGHEPMPDFPTPPPGASYLRAANLRALRAGVPGREPLSAPMLTLSRQTSTNPRGWFANVISTPTNRIALTAARLRRFGAPIGQVNGLDRYLSTIGGAAVEELVDPISAEAIERNIVADGKLVARVIKTFADVGEGRFLLTEIRYENARAGRPNQPAVTRVSFDNVHITTRTP